MAIDTSKPDPEGLLDSTYRATQKGDSEALKAIVRFHQGPVCVEESSNRTRGTHAKALIINLGVHCGPELHG